MRKYTDSERKEIEREAHELSGRRGWSAESAFEVARGLFNLKGILIGLGSLVIAAVVIITFVSGAYETIAREIELAMHECSENINPEYGHPDPHDGKVHFRCTVCYDDDGYLIDPVSRVETSRDEPEVSCSGKYTVYETWAWEIDGAHYEEENVKAVMEGEPKHAPLIETAAGVAKTCTTDGLSAELTCPECREVVSLQQPIPASHSFERLTDYEPDCQKGGYDKALYCTECGHTELGNEVGPTDHNYVLMYEHRATCKHEGYTGDLVCKGCGDVKETGKLIPSTDHDYYYMGQHPETGKHVYICAYCKHDQHRDTKD